MQNMSTTFARSRSTVSETDFGFGFFFSRAFVQMIRIVHGEMKLVIRIKHIDKTTANLQKSPPANGIYMWSYCEHCREVRTTKMKILSSSKTSLRLVFG